MDNFITAKCGIETTVICLLGRHLTYKRNIIRIFVSQSMYHYLVSIGNWVWQHAYYRANYLEFKFGNMYKRMVKQNLNLVT